MPTSDLRKQITATINKQIITPEPIIESTKNQLMEET